MEKVDGECCPGCRKLPTPPPATTSSPQGIVYVFLKLNALAQLVTYRYT